MFAAKMGVSASFGVIWIYAAELFPTVVRTNALSMGSMVGRVGGIGTVVNLFWLDRTEILTT